MARLGVQQPVHWLAIDDEAWCGNAMQSIGTESQRRVSLDLVAITISSGKRVSRRQVFECCARVETNRGETQKGRTTSR